jgi:hypothetical protein
MTHEAISDVVQPALEAIIASAWLVATSAIFSIASMLALRWLVMRCLLRLRRTIANALS